MVTLTDENRRAVRTFLIYVFLSGIVFGAITAIKIAVLDQSTVLAVIEGSQLVVMLSAVLTVLDEIVQHGRRFRAGQLTGALIGVLLAVPGLTLLYYLSDPARVFMDTQAGGLVMVGAQYGLVLTGILVGPRIKTLAHADGAFYVRVQRLRKHPEKPHPVSGTDIASAVKDRFFPTPDHRKNKS